MNNSAVMVDNSYLEEMKAAKDADAVLKLELITIKSGFPDAYIFVFEGNDDKIVYNHSALRDRNNLINGVYFFIDRDFDDFAGHSEHASTFTTDFYSVENYLVTADVLRQFLTNEFHCHGKPHIKEEIVANFEKIYSQFLGEMKEANFRIYLARKLKLNASNLPEKLSAFVSCDLVSVRKNYDDICTLIKTDREPSKSEVENHRAEFDTMEPKDRYRGKYCYKFFDRWLHELGKDYSLPESTNFKGIDRTSNAKLQEITLGSMASKARPPEKLKEFLDSLTL